MSDFHVLLESEAKKLDLHVLECRDALDTDAKIAFVRLSYPGESEGKHPMRKWRPVAYAVRLSGLEIAQVVDLSGIIKARLEEAKDLLTKLEKEAA